MPTTVQQERLEQRFAHWDADGSGTIEKSDFDTEAAQIIAGFGAEAGSAKATGVTEAFSGMWDKLAGWGGIGTDGSLTLEQFISVVDEHMLQPGDEGFDGLLRPTITAIVNLVDTDDDGQVNPAEYKVWLAAIGVDESTAESTFGEIDTNGNGQLSVDELVDAVKAFHAGTLDVSLLG